jgi:predicted metal-dependent hydrolase
MIVTGVSTPYRVQRSVRARRMRITVRRTGEVVVTVPLITPSFLVRKFVSQTEEWIVRKVLSIKQIPSRPNTSLLPSGQRDFISHRDEALRILSERVEMLNRHYGFVYKKVVIRNQKTRWGSCSHNGTINFNYRLAFLPDEVRDYVVVHELCHLAEFNHSKDFWKRVAQTVPEYMRIRRQLKTYSTA